MCAFGALFLIKLKSSSRGGVICTPYPYEMLNCNNFGPTELVVHAITKVYHTKPSTWKTFYLLRLEKIIDLNSDGEMAAF